GSNRPPPASTGVRNQIVQRLGTQDADIIALYSSPTATVDDPAFRAAVSGALDRVRARAEVDQVRSYYDTQAPAFVSADRHATYVVILLRPGSDTQKQTDYKALRTPLSAGN